MTPGVVFFRDESEHPYDDVVLTVGWVMLITVDSGGQTWKTTMASDLILRIEWI